MLIRLALLLSLLALVVAGCGSEPSSGNDVQERTMFYLGRELHCIHFKGADHGRWSGVVCDFVRYWRDNGTP